MSSSTSPPPGSPQEWLAHARSDLRYARMGESDPDVLPSQAAFHAQQAVEKAIKAALLHQGIAFPRTHDLVDLVQRWTKAGHAWPTALADAGTLNPYAVGTRYPGHVQQVSRADVRAAIAVAEKVVAWAAALLPPNP